MTYEAVQTIKLRRPDGTLQEVQPGLRFVLRNPGTASRLIVEGKIKVIEKYITKDRRRSLEIIMDAIIRSARDNAHLIGRWRQTTAMDEIEREIHENYQRVLSGQANLADYRDRVDKWLQAGTKGASNTVTLWLHPEKKI